MLTLLVQFSYVNVQIKPPSRSLVIPCAQTHTKRSSAFTTFRRNAIKCNNERTKEWNFGPVLPFRDVSPKKEVTEDKDNILNK
jgi:hypothetical protein